jgi:hypothetical protein
LFDGLANVSRKSETAGLGILQHELLEARLVNGHYALEQSFNLIFINIDARDVDTKLSKTCSSNKSDVTGTNNGNMHLTHFLNQQLTIKTLRATRVNHVTRKVNFG